MVTSTRVESELVLLEELQEVLGVASQRDLERVAAQFGIRLEPRGEDWRGRPAVAAATAARLRGAFERHLEECRARNREFEAWRERERQAFQERQEAEARTIREREAAELEGLRGEFRKDLEARHAAQQLEREKERQRNQGDFSRRRFDREHA